MDENESAERRSPSPHYPINYLKHEDICVENSLDLVSFENT